MTVGDFKSKFSQVVEGVKNGKVYAISYGRSKKKIAMITPYVSDAPITPKKRKLGLYDDKSKAYFAKDFKITDEELFTL